ncbi:cytochrome P450 [Serendipita vermifera]|nr:cytochrome P450 [Serendipita vermifera]
MLGEHTGSALLAVVVTTTLVLAKFRSYQKHKRFLKTFGEPDYRPAFHPLSPPGMLFGLAMDFTWDQRYTLYKEGQEVITLEPTVWGEPILYSRSPEVLRQVSGSGGAWYKPEWSMLGTIYWGKNILSENDAEWRKHRKIMQPSFNNETYESVWNEVNRFFKEMVTVDKWPTQAGQSISFRDVTTVTQKVALYAILSCGFGLSVSWDPSKMVTQGTHSITEGLEAQGENMIMLVFTPKWILNLPIKKLQHLMKAVGNLREWFNKSIANKKEQVAKVLQDTDGDMEISGLKRDVFTLMTLASQQDGKLHLEDSELIGDIWVMVFAGHETTSAALAATFCYLAAYPEEQHRVQEEIDGISKEIGGENEDLPFEEYGSFIKTRGAFLEALRLIPAANIMIRETREDTILQVPVTLKDGTTIEKGMLIPKDTTLVMDLVGLQRNPRTYSDPNEFRPSRWYKAEYEEMFTQFSIGPRSCIGRRFALTEGVCFLANVLKRYDVRPTLAEGENLQGWKNRVLGSTKIKMTLNVKEAPVTFVRRA